MKLYLIPILFLECDSQFTYPQSSDILYTDTTYNITWNDSNISNTNLYIFLTNDIDDVHNNITISNYNNGSSILNSFLGNQSFYQWNIPYELNKYNTNSYNFKFLLSNTSTPFIYTLGTPHFLYYYSEYFKIYSNLNITHPSANQIITPNNSFVSYYGFKNNLTLSFLYNPIDTFEDIPNISYNIRNSSPFYFDYQNFNSYSGYSIKAKLTEHYTNIELISQQFNIIGLDITTTQSIYLNPVNIYLTWNNYNYNGYNNIQVIYQGYIYESFLVSNNNFNLNVSNYVSGTYNISINNDLYPNEINDFIEINILPLTSTTQISTTTSVCFICPNIDSNKTDSNPFNYIHIIIIVVASISILFLIWYIYYKCKQIKTRNEGRKISPQLETISHYNQYSSNGFVDSNLHQYNHLKRSRLNVNENYENITCDTSTSSSISYCLNSNTYNQAIPYN